MPRALTSPRGALSAVGAIRNFTSVMRELSFDDERAQAETTPRLLVIAPDDGAAQRIGRALSGVAQSPAIGAWTHESAGRSTGAYDVVVVYGPISNDAFVTVRQSAGKESDKVFDLSSVSGEDERWAGPLRERIASALPDLAPALGRWYPPFRPAASKAVIMETATVNAQFALVSNIPAAIPVIGGFAAAGADFFVLTKNQVMMVFKLAAIHGLDLTDQWALVRELAPVVGAGFAWRTLAREASNFLPFMSGTVPKVAIAFTGTVAAGRAAEFYYRFGKRPSREQLQEFYSQAAESLKAMKWQMPGRSKAAAALPEPALDQ
jgi:uncharacterized protein (DUF697 family)